jgi:hypothetical protein
MNSNIRSTLRFGRTFVRPMIFIYMPVVGLLYSRVEAPVAVYFHIGRGWSDMAFYGLWPIGAFVILSILKLFWELGTVSYSLSDGELAVTYTVFHLFSIHTSYYKLSDAAFFRSASLGSCVIIDDNAMFIPRFAHNYVEIVERLGQVDIRKRRFYRKDLPKKSPARRLDANLLEEIRLGLRSGLRPDCIDRVMNARNLDKDAASRIVSDVEAAL